jgi:hypothetical protein
MTVAISVVVVVLLIAVAGAVFLAALVINIHRVDRSKRLIDVPRTYTDAATRRVLGVGVRTPGLHSDEQE